MKLLLAVFACLLLAAASAQKPQWTAYFPLNSTCDFDITGDYDLLSLATDSQGRVWQFGGRSGCATASLRYFTRTTPSWTVVWTSSDSAGPTIRGDNTVWIDKDDNLYIYGGQIQFPNAEADFWRYSISSNTWTELTIGDGSRYASERGVEDPANYPGGRRGAGYWYTPDDNSLWVFGGVVPDYDPGYPDLWRFNISSQHWSFVAGLLEQVNETTEFTNALEVTPYQRWGALSAVDEHYNLWLFGGEMMSDLWMFNRSSGWKLIDGDGSLGAPCQANNLAIYGQFSSQIRPDCSAYSSMTYAGNNILALWTSYTDSDEGVALWLYNITSQQWLTYDFYNYTTVADVLLQPDASTSPGNTDYTRVNAHGTLWVVADASHGVFSMDVQCLDVVRACSEYATCTPNHTQMSPTCACNEGYEGNGITCSLPSMPQAAPSSSAPSSPSTPSTPSSSTPKGTKASSSVRLFALNAVSALLVIVCLM